MNTATATTLRAQLQILIAKYGTVITDMEKSGIVSEMNAALDPHREFFQPFLEAEYQAAKDSLAAALLDACFDDSAVAADLAEQTPLVRQRKESWNSFGTHFTPRIVADAEQAIVILTNFIGS